MYMRLKRNRMAREIREQEAREKAMRRKEAVIAWGAMFILLLVLGWHSPDLLSNWHYKEYIIANR